MTATLGQQLAGPAGRSIADLHAMLKARGWQLAVSRGAGDGSGQSFAETWWHPAHRGGDELTVKSDPAAPDFDALYDAAVARLTDPSTAVEVIQQARAALAGVTETGVPYTGPVFELARATRALLELLPLSADGTDCLPVLALAFYPQLVQENVALGSERRSLLDALSAARMQLAATAAGARG